MSNRAVKPDTAMSAALHAAGVKTPAERLDDAVMEAAAKNPGNESQVLDDFWDAIKRDAALLEELIGGHRHMLCRQRVTATMTALRELEEERQREEAAKQPKKSGSGGGGQAKRDHHAAVAPASGAGRPQAFGSYAERRPSGFASTLLDRQRQRDRITAAANFDRKSLWDSYLIHQQPLRRCSLGLIRSTTRIRGIEHRWFELLGRVQALDTLKVEDVWTAEQVEEFYAQAKRETGEQEAA